MVRQEGDAVEDKLEMDGVVLFGMQKMRVDTVEEDDRKNS